MNSSLSDDWSYNRVMLQLVVIAGTVMKQWLIIQLCSWVIFVYDFQLYHHLKQWDLNILYYDLLVALAITSYNYI